MIRVYIGGTLYYRHVFFLGHHDLVFLGDTGFFVCFCHVIFVIILFAFVPVITISGNITIKANFDKDSVEYLDDELHVQDRKMNEYAHVLRYLGILDANVEGRRIVTTF